MPLFIALGDEMRLSIIEVLTEEALDRRQTPEIGRASCRERV